MPVLAFLGKGGVGKTVLAALAGRALAGRRLLYVDADPAQGLSMALGAEGVLTLGAVRDRVVAEARERSGAEVAAAVDYHVLEALREADRFALLAMGRSEKPGCYCSVNGLLRDAIERLADAFDAVVVDAEAGIEQVNRQVTRRVTHPILVTDASARGAATAASIAELLARGGTPAAGAVFNRAAEPAPAPAARLAQAGVRVLGAVPVDERVAAFDRDGRPLTELPDDAPALAAVRRVLATALGAA